MHPQRDHRRLAAYLALHAWQRGLDCIAVEANTLREYLNVGSLKPQRVDRIVEDAKFLFPHSKGVNLQDGWRVYFSSVPITGVPSLDIHGRSREWEGHTIARVQPPTPEVVEECLMRLALGHPVSTVFQVVNWKTGTVEYTFASEELAVERKTGHHVVQAVGMPDDRQVVPFWIRSKSGESNGR